MPTNFNIGGTDVDQIFVSRSYLIDRYPEIAGTFEAGGLYTWGASGSFGVLGDNTTTNKSSPVQTAAGGTNWTQLSISSATSCAAIKSNGTLWTWGYNATYGPLGNNSTISRSSPVQTVAGGTNWKQISVGGSITPTVNMGAIKTDGTLWTWGSNGSGALGDNTAIFGRSSPIQTISGGTNWKQISMGGNNAAAIKTDGTLWVWGANTQGALGDNTTVGKSSPVQTISGTATWKLVSTAQSMVAAIKNDNSLWLWGYNNRGQLGDNSITPKSSPIQTVAGGNNWNQVATGYNIVGAIKTDGTLWMWGWNDIGQLGDNTTVTKSSPVQTVAGGTNWKKVAVSSSSTNTSNTSSAVKTNGTLWLWGSNNNGKIGDNTVIARSSPVQTIAGGYNWISSGTGAIIGAAIRDFSTDYLYIPSISPATQTVTGTTGVAITSTTAYTATYFAGTMAYSISPALPTGLALNTSTGVVSGTPTQPTVGIYTVSAVGSLGGTATAIINLSVGSAFWLWGRNNYGQLGNNSLVDRSSPVQTISGTTTWSQMSVGYQHSGSVKNAGTLWLWGRNNYGQLGDNTVITRSSPVQTIAGTSIWRSVACGSMFSAGIKTDGSLWSWGYNGWGQLGNNDSLNKSSPVQTVASGTNWSQVSANGYSSNSLSAIKTDGTLWTWGRNTYGQLGDNSTISTSSPIQTIASGFNWSKVSQGTNHTAAIKTNGTLWLWGIGTLGALGDNTVISKSSPVQTVAAGTDWTQVSAGYDFTAAVKSDGTLWTWGRNTYGQLGNNGYSSVVGESSPIQTIAAGTNWLQVGVGGNSVGAVKTDGTLWTWGINNYGQSGTNTTSPFRQSSPVQTIASGTSWRQVYVGNNSLGALK